MRLSHVRRAFRLIGELRQIGADPQQWRPHLLRNLARLLEADLIISSEVHFRTTDKPGVLKVIDIGWGLERDGDDGASEPWQIHTEREEDPQTYLIAVAKHDRRANPIVPIAPATRLRGGRSFVLSQYPLAHLGAIDQLGLHRYSIERPFTVDESKLVRFFHVELGRLWKKDALHRAADPTAELPPRLSQTLDGILQGESEKQIAFHLGLSTHTVHNYIRALHRRFNVSSRAELIAKASEERFDFRPRLSIKVARTARGGRAGGVPPQPDPT
ncbi:MAG: LuxR C-terminal-related transcriptional regulator [Tepidisphaeraceae bacterium]